ncbi:AFG1-like ATPase-domain-containing protein [Tricladium varicosporioides]|nr:AFG1-like ATPase-domain-containing protein [Hymenoscyphus varicosporioides]
MSAPLAAPITSLTITNPLVLYRSLLSTKQIAPDPAQHRLALHLQRLYSNLKDYSPHVDYGSRLKALNRAINRTPREGNGSNLAAPGHPIRRNPLFAHLFSEKEKRDTLALTRALTSHEEAMRLDSPRGLLLYGEVGTGKSMMVDLLADCLPNRKKRRWHFNTFMLESLALLEQRRIKSSRLDSEHSLLWLAKGMIEKSPILFLDEFQLPDRAASKILCGLLTVFFQLGGVLIASSNRMPDELAKASGMDFAAPPRGFMSKMLGFSDGKRSSMFPANNEYAKFVGVLKARCEIWDIRSEKDWRRREVEDSTENDRVEELQEKMINMGSVTSTISNILPKKYLLASDDNEWESMVRAALPADTPSDTPWESSTLLVYGRKVPIPRHYGGVTFWKFKELCEETFGPADYITLASTFHTLILDDVPVLRITQKNEARRLITLLDALYEARCKLIIRAEAGPDDLFFPEVEVTSGTGQSIPASNDGRDAVYPETLSEVYQDQTSPFRPNTSAYTDDPRKGYRPNENSDFGSIPRKGNEIGCQVDFSMTASFTGEDEIFAYKRAASRLWEMCSAKWHARSGSNWWRPLPLEVRRWEQSSTPSPKITEQPSLASDVRIGGYVELNKLAGLQGKEIEE